MKKIKYEYFVSNEEGEQVSMPDTYKEAKKVLDYYIMNGSGYHRYKIERIEVND